MQPYLAPFGIGFAAGMRSMTASAALVWAASLGRTDAAWIPSGRRARLVALAAAVGETVVDKTPLAPDRRTAPSFLLRLAIGAAGGLALAGRGASPAGAALSGMAGAAAGTLLGSAARRAADNTWASALAEDVLAASLAAALVGSAGRRSTRSSRGCHNGDVAKWFSESTS